jgi:phospholipid/cholesterol/gamma-HCH transport system substrate-binding protein
VTTIVENAGGLRNGDPAQMRGVNIGRVSSFEMAPGGGVAIRMEILNRYPVPEDSRVVLRSAGMLGGMIVDVVPGTSAERVERGEVLPGTVEPDIMSSVGNLGTQAEEVMARASALLAPQNVEAIGASAAELRVLLADLGALAANQRAEMAQLSASLRRSAAGVERITAGVEQATDELELERAIANVDSLTARLGETSDQLYIASTTLNTVLSRVEQGEGSLGMLLNDEDLYENMNAAVLSLRELIVDIKANPGRYLDISVF